MNKAELLLAVASSVESTPVDKLISGTVLDFQGCRCAIGCYAYDTVPGFKELADTLAALPTDDGFVHEETYAAYSGRVLEMATMAYQKIEQVAMDSFIYSVNDSIFARNKNRKQAQKKIIERFREMAAKMVA